MPIKKPKKKIRQRDTQKTIHTLDLLHSRALISLTNFLDYEIDNAAHASMERLFRDYRSYKIEVKDALLAAFQFLTKERFAPDPNNPDRYPADTGKPPSKKEIKMAKRYINQIAKKVWKK